MPPQQVVWDPVKARRNKKKHGVDFEEAATVFRDQLLLILPDPAHSGEENRWVALGKSVSQLLLVVVHTEDERTVRIISARKAEPRERGNMNRNSKRPRKNNEVQPEYDFGRALRGKYLKRFPQDVVMVTLAPDVALAFPDAEAVDAALRVLLKAAKKAASSSAKRASQAA